MQLREFRQALSHLTADDLHALASELGAHADSAADEVEAWRTTLAIDRALRRAHRSRDAARAASDATHCVLAAAEGNGIALPDADVTHVARAAAEVARGIVAGSEVEVEVEHLMVNWTLLVGAHS